MLFTFSAFAAPKKFDVQKSTKISQRQVRVLLNKGEVRPLGAVYKELYPPCYKKKCPKVELIDGVLYKNPQGQYFYKFVVLMVDDKQKRRSNTLIRYKEAGTPRRENLTIKHKNVQ